VNLQDKFRSPLHIFVPLGQGKWPRMAHQERRNGCGSSLHRRPDEMMMTSIVGAGAGAGAGIHLVVFF
jgi:hypothetical protein